MAAISIHNDFGAQEKWNLSLFPFFSPSHSSTLAWKIPWMKEPGGLPSLGSHRVGHDWSDLAAAAAAAAEFCQENALVIANTLFKQHKRRSYTWTSADGQYRNQIDYNLWGWDREALYSQQKQDGELSVTHIMNSLLPNSDLKKVGKTTSPFRYDLNQISGSDK